MCEGEGEGGGRGQYLDRAVLVEAQVLEVLQYLQVDRLEVKAGVGSVVLADGVLEAGVVACDLHPAVRDDAVHIDALGRVHDQHVADQVLAV